MTAAEADQIITLSRTTLLQYRQMVGKGQWPIEDLTLFQDQIDRLEAIVVHHPGKIEKTMALVVDWCDLRGQVRQRLH